jgi:DNA repair exonuclease SbcCD ATPase subunit
MHLREIEIENVRGITHWGEEFGSENVRILGPNGSGKSSVIQAVEFILTGDIDALRGPGTEQITFKKYASHMEADPDEAWVVATFSEAGERDISIKRTVDTPDKFEVVDPSDIDEAPEWLRRQMNAAELGHSILTRDGLLRFVTAPEGERGNHIDRLFRLESIDEKRTSLKGAVRDHKKPTLDGKKEAKDAADGRFFDLFSSGVSSRSGALTVINERREENGADPVESLEDDFTADIGIMDQVSVDPLRSDGTVRLLRSMEKRIPDQRSQFSEVIRSLDDNLSHLEEAEDMERELNTLDLVESGLGILEEYDSECPLCLSDWDDQELRELLERRRRQANDLKSLKNEVNKNYSEVNELLVGYIDNLEKLGSELEEEYPEESGTVLQVVESARGWKQELKDGALTDVPNKSDPETDIFPESLETTLGNLSEVAEGKSELDPATQNVDLLARADDRYQDLVEKESELERAREVNDLLESINQHFKDARSRVLTEAFDDISERFESYYQQMHPDEEAKDFSAILEPTDTGARFEPKFYDQGHHHPGAVHSEGHRDSMGLALFLAMSDVGGEDIDILLLDDVIMSIDSGHRSNIADVLANKVSDRYQILLTTHDKTWDRHLSLTQEFEKQIRFSKCSLGAGPLSVDSITDPWQRIDYHLEQNDVTAAAAWIRKTVEWYSRRACTHLDAEVPYHRIEDQDFSIGLLFSRAIEKYQSLLESKNAVDETEYDADLYDPYEVEAELEAIRAVKQEQDRHHNLLNSNVHFNEPEAAFYTGEELKNEREAFKDAYDLLFCSDCNSWVRNGDYVFCDCTIRVG